MKKNRPTFASSHAAVLLVRALTYYYYYYSTCAPTAKRCVLIRVCVRTEYFLQTGD